MKLILRFVFFSCIGLYMGLTSVFAQKYGLADTFDEKLRIPQFVQPAFDYWMRDTWVTLGPDEYYYMTGTTADPNRVFPGQMHCWDWNDGLYLWRSKDMIKC